MRIGGARHKTKEEEKAVKKSEIAAIKSSQTDKSDKKAPAEKKKKQIGWSEVQILVLAKFFTMKSPLNTTPTPFIEVSMIVIHVRDAFYDCTLSHTRDVT